MLIKSKPAIRVLTVLALLSAAAGSAESAAWDARLAGKFSGRLREIERGLAGLAPQLELLPKIPIDDKGGTSGYASSHTSAKPAPDSRHAVEIRWPEERSVDMVALVPARRYDATGLDAQYGMPDAFTVELIGASGETIARVAREKGARSNPVRRGHPFVYQVSPAVAASGVRISADVLGQATEDEGAFATNGMDADRGNQRSYVHAWAEVFAFEGERNLTREAEVRSIGGNPSGAQWQWKPAFLVDGQTPLGLPEVPEVHGNIGWISEGRAKASESASLSVDLGESAMIDAVRLLPAEPPTSDLPSGFGFPRKLNISVSETGETGERGKWAEVASVQLRNPGHNPVIVPFEPSRGRFVRIEAAELWKAFDSYPAFFALSEVEVLAGDENLAAGKVVRSSDGMSNLIAPGGRYWSGAALSDGFGPNGRLVSTREWMVRLDERLRLETLRHELLAESERLIAGWRSAGLITFALLGLAGAFLLIVLPIRFRIHANHELLKVRERIAGDLHDEVGSNLGSIQMIADLAEGRSGPSAELKRIQRIAAETVSAVRDIVWLLRPEGEHRIATVEHLRETSSIMLETLEWKFSANEEAWKVELPEEETRHLFLYFREALHNIMRHAKAAKVGIRVERSDGDFRLVIEDDGVGIAADRIDRPATLRALRQRSEALGAELRVDSRPGEGTRLELIVPLNRKRPRKTRKSPLPAVDS
jgi:signal transduction histidine kinase